MNDTLINACICGDNLILTIPKIYGINKIVYCNQCDKEFHWTDIIYHCMQLNCAMHIDGYDLCEKCTSELHIKYLYDMPKPTELSLLLPSIYVTTWNVNGKNPPDSLKNLLNYDCINNEFDIYVIGLQEIIDLNTSNLLLNNNADIVWEYKISQELNKNKYSKLHSICLMGMLLIIYVKNSIKRNISNIMSNKCGSGFCGFVGNKGGIGIRFEIFNKSFCFLCCHFAAGSNKNALKERNNDYNKIIQKFMFLPNDKYAAQSSISIPILKHDIIFVLGDLNYRLEFNEYELGHVDNLIQLKKWDQLLLKDQLLKEIKNKQTFVDFNECKINFQPTYKYEIGANKYDYKRIPSYCDRILWKTNKNLDIKCLKYDCCLQEMISDHRAVVGIFQM